MDLVAQKLSFKTFDGTKLVYRAWHPKGVTQNRALILFHGGHEHSGRFQDLVEKLCLENISVFAWDARGHGLSPGVRGYAEHYMDVIRDVDSFIHHITDTYSIETSDMVLMGHSVGSVTVATWLHDYAPNIRGAVLGSPAFDVKLYAPFAYPALKLLHKFRKNSFVSSYVKPQMLTHDEKEIEERRSDELISPNIAVSVLISLYDTAKRVIADAHTIKTPILVLSAGKDWVVKRRAQHKFIQNLGSDDKEISFYPDFYHEIYHEKERHRPIKRAKTFINECFSFNHHKPNLVETGENQQTYSELKQPLTSTDLKKYYFGINAFILKNVGGNFSNGLNIGWRQGFDSGSMLNYVYANQAKGKSPLGKLMDRIYLDSPGWIGIRKRAENLQHLLQLSITELKKTHEKICIMDVAAGPGRYMLHFLQTMNDSNISVLCRDMDEAGLKEGRELAESLNLTSLIEYQRGDAFDHKSLANTPVHPNIVVVSGLYELIEDNTRILHSLQGIHDCLANDGILIYTNQPWHPQLEMIARTLVNRDQQPWIMRPRSQTEMNQLVEHAGFKPQKMLLDNAGIFTVSMAKKIL